MRSGNVKKRQLLVDPVYKSKVVTRMINVLMLKGKKSLAEDIVYTAISRLAEDKKEALTAFENAVKNVMPNQEVRSRRVGGATYQVPYPTKHDRAEALAVRWIVNAARAKEGTPMVDRLYKELKDAYDGIGDALKKRDETHKSADSNRAFAHFARF